MWECDGKFCDPKGTTVISPLYVKTNLVKNTIYTNYIYARIYTILDPDYMYIFEYTICIPYIHLTHLALL